MKRLKTLALRIIQILIALYLCICALMYFYQERLIFAPTKLPVDFKFTFDTPFEEFNIITEDEDTLNALLFKADTSKGVIYYLHGNAGALNSWGGVADTYTDLGYDVFLMDYRGYGKSSGTISSEKELYSDVQKAYNLVRSLYAEHKIIVLGYSIGTGPASMIAAKNSPGRLILQAPYYNMADLVQQHYSFVPVFLLKYSFDNAMFLPKIKAPVTIFHGTNDAIINYGSSLKLQKLFKPQDELITLPGGRHNGMSSNPNYLLALKKLLAK